MKATERIIGEERLKGKRILVTGITYSDYKSSEPFVAPWRCTQL